MLPDADGVWHLNMNVRFRSRDAFDAAFMNCFAFVNLMERTAKEIGEQAGREVRLGRYVDMSDSYHIYGRRREAFESGFLKQVGSRSFEDRTWSREDAEEFFAMARPQIAEKVKSEAECELRTSASIARLWLCSGRARQGAPHSSRREWGRGPHWTPTFSRKHNVFQQTVCTSTLSAS